MNFSRFKKLLLRANEKISRFSGVKAFQPENHFASGLPIIRESSIFFEERAGRTITARSKIFSPFFFALERVNVCDEKVSSKISNINLYLNYKSCMLRRRRADRVIRGLIKFIASITLMTPARESSPSTIPFHHPSIGSYIFNRFFSLPSGRSTVASLRHDFPI